MVARKRIILPIISFLAIIFLFGLIELGIRIFFTSYITYELATAIQNNQVKNRLRLNPHEEDLFVFDSILGWKLIPNTRCYMIISSIKPVKNEQIPEYKYLVFINSLGYRTWEFTPKKKESVYRIICAGDSCVFGWGVNFEDTFSQKLDVMLEKQKSEKDVEIISSGIPGYSSRQRLFLLEDEILPKYKPDLIISAYGRNDEILANYPDNMTINRYGYLRKIDNLLMHSAFYNILKRFQTNLSYKRNQENKKDSICRVTLAETMDNFEKISESAKKYNCKVIFLNMILFSNRHKLINEFFEKNNFDFIDITTLLQNSIKKVKSDPAYQSQIAFYREYLGDSLFDSDEKFYITVNRAHPNSIGHQIIAEALFEKIMELNVIH